MTDQTPAITEADYAAKLRRNVSGIAEDLTAALLDGTGLRFEWLPQITPADTTPDAERVARLRAAILAAYGYEPETTPRRRWARRLRGSGAAAAGDTLW